MEKVDIFILKINDINDNYDYLYNNFSIEDKKEVDKYKINKDKLLHLGSLYLKRKYIKGNIYNNEYGKPLNDNISFNISHSNEYVIIGISKTNIGIDIEYIKDVKDNLINYCLSDNEKNNLNKYNFYYFWTRKEAYFKLLGKGILYKEIKNIDTLKLNNIYFESTKIDNYYLSIAKENEFTFNINYVSIIE